MLHSHDFVAFFKECLTKDPNVSVPLAAMKTLIKSIEISKAETLSELNNNLKIVQKQLKENIDSSITSVASGCELLIRFITLAAPDVLLAKDFSECKKVLAERGHDFLENAQSSRQKISSLGQQFVFDDATILVHSKSRVVIHLLWQAYKMNKRFKVYITESVSDGSGRETQAILTDNGIPCSVILDSAVGFIMERIDMVLLGAEAVVESGGIINRIGSFQISVMAKVMNKPVYVAVESFKFVREYPLKQREVTNKYKYLDNESFGHPSVDYTPPSYIALLFTDLGVLTPSAVSDELIKLYL